MDTAWLLRRALRFLTLFTVRMCESLSNKPLCVMLFEEINQLQDDMFLKQLFQFPHQTLSFLSFF